MIKKNYFIVVLIMLSINNIPTDHTETDSYKQFVAEAKVAFEDAKKKHEKYEKVFNQYAAICESLKQFDAMRNRYYHLGECCRKHSWYDRDSSGFGGILYQYKSMLDRLTSFVNTDEEFEETYAKFIAKKDVKESHKQILTRLTAKSCYPRTLMSQNCVVDLLRTKAMLEEKLDALIPELYAQFPEMQD